MISLCHFPIFPSTPSLLPCSSLSHDTFVGIQTYVQSKGAFCRSHSLSLGEQQRGLARVSRIMITAAEKHISGDKGRQSASRGLNQLPVAYWRMNRKVTTNNQATSGSTHIRNRIQTIIFSTSTGVSDFPNKNPTSALLCNLFQR